MSSNGSTIVSGFFANLLTNALIWAVLVLACSSLWPNSNHLYLLFGLGFGTLIGVFNTTGLKRDTPLKPYLFGKFVAWLVTVVVWALMAITSKGPIPTVMIVWASGIIVLVSIVGLLLYIAMGSNRRRSYY